MAALILHIFDADFTRQGMIENYVSCVWQEDYYGSGDFLLVCADTPNNVQLLQQWRYVYAKGKRTAMIIRYIRRESADRQIIVQGYTAKRRIAQRIVLGTQQVSGAVEASMYALVNNNIRGLTIKTAPPVNLPGAFATQFTGTNLLDALERLGRESEIGHYVVFDYQNKQHVFTAYKGIDRTIGKPDSFGFFSEEFGNLKNLSLVDDTRMFYNVAHVAGGGEGVERVWVEVGDAAGDERFEMFVDARDIQREEGQSEAQYLQLLAARGIERLNAHNRINPFIAEIEPSGFGVIFDLGDEVTCQSIRYGVRIDTRILHYAEIRENSKTTLKLTLGEPEITSLQVVRSWLN